MQACEVCPGYAIQGHYPAIDSLKSVLTCTLDFAGQLQNQVYTLLGLFLIDPMARAIDQLGAAVEAVGDTLCPFHGLDRPRFLIGTPVPRAGGEDSGHADPGTCPGEAVARNARLRLDAVPVQAALEAGAGPLVHIDGELGVWEPARATVGYELCVFFCHVARDGLAHAVGLVHDVVPWHFGQFARRPARQGVRLVAVPVGRLEVEVAPEKCVQGRACGVGHLVVGGSGAVVVLVVFPGAGEFGEGLLYVCWWRWAG